MFVFIVIHGSYMFLLFHTIGDMQSVKKNLNGKPIRTMKKTHVID